MRCGHWCGHWAAMVPRAMRTLPGVRTVPVDLGRGEARVVGNMMERHPVSLPWLSA